MAYLTRKQVKDHCTHTYMNTFIHTYTWLLMAYLTRKQIKYHFARSFKIRFFLGVDIVHATLYLQRLVCMCVSTFMCVHMYMYTYVYICLHTHT